MRTGYLGEIKDTYYGYGFHRGEFIPDKYEIVKDKYDYEED